MHDELHAFYLLLINHLTSIKVSFTIFAQKNVRFYLHYVFKFNYRKVNEIWMEICVGFISDFPK